MTRISRSVAQRYAAAKKRRRKATPRGPIASPAYQEAAASDEPSAAATAPSPPQSAIRPAVRQVASPSRPARRPAVDYKEQYRYVWTDIRRIVIVAGGLLAGLVALSFVVR